MVLRSHQAALAEASPHYRSSSAKRCSCGSSEERSICRAGQALRRHRTAARARMSRALRALAKATDHLEGTPAMPDKPISHLSSRGSATTRVAMRSAIAVRAACSTPAGRWQASRAGRRKRSAGACGSRACCRRCALGGSLVRWFADSGRAAAVLTRAGLPTSSQPNRSSTSRYTTTGGGTAPQCGETSWAVFAMCVPALQPQRRSGDAADRDQRRPVR